jgi:aspartyl-tRNA(Asn)/glutamyl-tRNA(Gln) amidotransferase subunit B
LTYIGVNNGSLEKGAFRCDANISLRGRGASELGTKVEVKNMNSFRAVHRALQYEIQRQTAVLVEGGAIVQETRGWVEAQGATVGQRSKEYAHDYRYFAEPDLPPLALDTEYVERVRATLPEMPAARRHRFEQEYRLSRYDAGVLTASRDDADAYEHLVSSGVSAKLAANWMMGDVAALANERGTPLRASGLGVAGLAALLRMLETGHINGPTAKELLAELYLSGGDPARIVEERGLAQVSDESALEDAVEAAIIEQAAAAADFRAGKEAALGRLVGAVMKATGGKADPRLVNRLLRERLSR